MRLLLNALVADRRGATSIEHALVGVLVGVAIIAGLAALAQGLEYWFGATSTAVQRAG